MSRKQNHDYQAFLWLVGIEWLSTNVHVDTNNLLNQVDGADEAYNHFKLQRSLCCRGLSLLTCRIAIVVSPAQNPLLSLSCSLTLRLPPLIHSSLQTFIASPGTSSASLPRPHFAFPSNQSVNVTILLVLSYPLLSSACSMVCVAIRPSLSKLKMNMPENSSPLLRENNGASPPRSLLRPRLIPPFWPAGALLAAARLLSLLPLCPLPVFFGSVFQRTTNFSSPRFAWSSR